MYLSHRLRLRLDGLLVARGLRLHQLQEVLVYFLGIYPEVSALADAEDKALLARARRRAGAPGADPDPGRAAPGGPAPHP